MAKKSKSKINKTQAVTDYLKANPQAKASEIAGALTKKGIAITPGHVANIKSKMKNGKKKTRSPVTAVAATAPKPEPVTLNETITLEQIRKVAKTIQAVGGFVKLSELLGVIQNVGACA